MSKTDVTEMLMVDSNPYVLIETDSMENVFLPIRNTARVKYTCFDVSQRFVVFGSTSGGIYVFIRDTLQYLKSVTNKDGPVSQVAIAPDDSILAFSTSRGHVVVLEHNAEKEGVQPHRLQFTYDHKGALVTSLHWSNTTARLYAGDDTGRVSMINVSLSRTRSYFQVPSATLMKVDSRVVQLDYSKDFLLVSSLTRSYIYNTNTEQWVQIGKKLRDGEFGACLYPGPRYQDPCTIYTARPGARLWEADLRGNVLSTHQFKQALCISATKLVTYKDGLKSETRPTDESSSRSVMGFTKLYALWPSHALSPFILTWSSNGFCILNPKKAEVLLRCDEFSDIKCVKCYKSYLYINYQLDKFARIAVLPPDKAVGKLFRRELYSQCASFMVDNGHFFTTTTSISKKSSLTPANYVTLLHKLKETGQTRLLKALSPLIDAIQALEDKKKRNKDSLDTPAKNPRRPRSALAHHSDPNRSRRASPQPTRCRSASPMLRQRHPSGSPTVENPLFVKKTSALVKSHEEISSVKPKHKYKTHRKTKSESNVPPRPSTSNGSTSSLNMSAAVPVEKPHDIPFKPLPLALNGLLSPVDECRTECSPVTNVPLPLSTTENGASSPSSSLTLSLYNPSIASDTPPILNVDPSSEVDSNIMSSSQGTLNGSSSNGSLLNPSEELASSEMNFDVPYRLLSLSVHGGGLVFPPGFDYSLLSNHEAGELPPIDLGKLKDSISSTFTSGKKVLLQNWKDLENRFKQMGINETSAVVPKGFVHSNSMPSSAWDPADDGTNKENQGDPNGTYLDNRSWSSKALHDSSIWEDAPPVDIGTLLSATLEARSRLRDPDILLDPIGRREVLQSWVNVLNETQLEVLHFVHNQTSPLQEPCDNEFEDINLEVNGNICQTSLGKKNQHPNYHPDFIPPSSKKLQLRDSSVIVYSPFRVTSEIHAQMSALAVSCFRTKILGDSLSELGLFFPSCNGILDQMTQQSTAPDLLNGETRSNLSDKNGNTSGGERFKDSSSTLDCNLALFVSNYFHLLCGNSERREKQVEEFVHLQHESGFCGTGESSSLVLETRFKTWCAFNDGIQVLRRRDEFDRALQKNNLIACVENLLESFRITRVTISRIMQLSRIDYNKTLEVCSSLCHQISPIDLLYISLCTGHHHPRLFLKCVDLILKDTPAKHKSQIITSLFSSYEVRMNWIRFAINQPPETDGNLVNLRCSVCGNPVPGSHLYQWPMGKELLHVLDTFGSDETTSQHLTQFCQEKGFWPGYLLLLKKRKENAKRLKTILLLDDARLLSTEHPLGCFPEDERQWSSFLVKLSAWHEKRKSAKGDPPWKCTSCGAPIGPTACFSEQHSLTLDVAIRRMLTVYPPADVIRMVRSLDVPNGALSAMTYRASILTHLIDTQQSILSHSILARVESYLWLRRSTCIPPQIWQVFEEESRQRGETSHYKKSPLNESKPQDSPPSLKQRCLRYLEEPENNWGVTTRIQRTCPLCGIQLCTYVFGANRVSSKATGVTIGSCGHAFHSSCLGHQVTPCPLCVDRAKLKKDN